jgi:hypothetical protein
VPHGLNRAGPGRGCIVRRVDPLLNVSAGLDEGLPHLTDGSASELFIPLTQEIPGLPQDVLAGRSQGLPPDLESTLGSLNRAIDVLFPRAEEPTNQIFSAGGITVVKIALPSGVRPIPHR